MNTMEITKIVGALAGSLLVLLLIQFAGELIYDTDAGVQAYLVETPEPAEEAPVEEDIDFDALIAAANPGAGEAVWRRCQACHTLDAGENRVGPYLAGVVGRDIATAQGFNYSPALAGIDGVWDYEHLYHFLRNPREYAPGTTMNFAGLASQEERANIIAYLEQH